MDYSEIEDFSLTWVQVQMNHEELSKWNDFDLRNLLAFKVKTSEYDLFTGQNIDAKVKKLREKFEKLSPLYSVIKEIKKEVGL